jgi:hypothetical protein
VLEILVGRILEIHRNVDVRHTETADARRLVRQCLVMGVEPQVDNVADAESVDIGQLRFGRLAGCRYPIIETTPVIDRFRVGHGTLLLSAQGDPGQPFFNLIIGRARLSPSPG